MPDLLDDKLVTLYFQPEAGLLRANADLVLKGSQDKIMVGDRILFTRADGIWEEGNASQADASKFHPLTLRLPDKYQSSYVRVTCPDCHFTYSHQHIFAEGTK